MNVLLLKVHLGEKIKILPQSYFMNFIVKLLSTVIDNL